MPAPSSLLVDILSKFCCCKGNTSVDHERLLNSGHNDDEYTLPNGYLLILNHLTTSLFNLICRNGGVSFPNNRSSDRNLLTQPVRTREEEEEDLMNKILDRTQQVNLINLK